MSKPENHPQVSVIMPIRNEAGFIQKGLTSVLSQDYPPDKMQIIIADGMSTDNTRDIISELISKFPRHSVKAIDNQCQIVPTGMNQALQIANGEIIVRVDGHCVIARDYVIRCVQHLEQEVIDGVGGPIETIGETYIAQAIAIGMSSSFGVGGSAFRTIKDKSIFVDTVAFPAYKRDTIVRVGWYDEELVRNQDDEYNYRIRKMGGRILLSPDIKSKYYIRSSLGSLFRQYFQYGFWKVRVLQKHLRQMKLRQFVPPAFVASLLTSAFLAIISSLLSNPHPQTFISLFIILGSYLFANLAASIWTASHRGWSYLFLLPLVYSTLHISYGLGFLVGLLKFAGRWGDKIGKVPRWKDPLG